MSECLNAILRLARVDSARFSPAEYLETTLLPLLTPLDAAKVYTDAIRLHERYQLQFYDALIVAAAIEAGCSTLYSEDMQHGQYFDSVRVVNPFA